jgi:hypothetical protein
MKIKLSLLIPVLTILALAVPFSTASVSAKTIPGISIVSVVPGQVVTIQTSNFPANLDFDVVIGPYGKYGLTGYKVATTNSGSGGAFTATYNIPADYKNAARLAIRLTNQSKGYYAYNWFENVVPTPAPTAIMKTPIPGYKGTPSIKIQSVVSGQFVGVEGTNFPPNAELNVRMHVIGTRGKNGYLAGTVKAGDTGQFTAKFSIPTEVAGLFMIAIRVEDPASGYYGYNWFFNTNTPLIGAGSAPDETDAAGKTGGSPAVTATPAYAGFPTLEITAVEMGKKVTLAAANLPAGKTFEVYLGTLNQMTGGGMKVATMAASSDGTATLTVEIPPEFSSLWKISVRIIDNETGYYAYNWFYNQTYP